MTLQRFQCLIYKIFLSFYHDSLSLFYHPPLVPYLLVPAGGGVQLSNAAWKAQTAFWPHSRECPCRTEPLSHTSPFLRRAAGGPSTLVYFRLRVSLMQLFGADNSQQLSKISARWSTGLLGNPEWPVWGFHWTVTLGFFFLFVSFLFKLKFSVDVQLEGTLTAASC